MKKISSWLLVLIVSLFLVATIAFAGGKKEQELFISFLKSQAQNEHGQAYAKMTVNSLKSAFPDATITLTDSENDVAKQISQAETLINSGVKIILLEAVSAEGNAPIAKMCKDAGVYLITVNAKLAESAQKLAVTFIGAQNSDLGSMEMEYIAEKIGGKGNIAIINGPIGHEAQVGRREGYNKVLAKYPDIKVIFEGSGMWQSEKAQQIAENWLQSGKQIDAFVCQNDDMANGAALAAQDAGKTGILFAGVDGLSFGIGLVEKGVLTCTVEQGTRAAVAKQTEVCQMIVKGQINKIEKEYIVPGAVIEASNVEKWK